GLVTVNASPRRRELRTTLRAWERPMYAPVLIISGALLALPTIWIIAAVPALQALRIAARWVSTRYARLALPLRDLTPHFGLGTVAQGGTALALAVNYFITYGSGPESPGGGASGMDAGAARGERRRAARGVDPDRGGVTVGDVGRAARPDRDGGGRSRDPSRRSGRAVRGRPGGGRNDDARRSGHAPKRAARPLGTRMGA